VDFSDLLCRDRSRHRNRHDAAPFLVADLSQPFAGLMQLPKEQLRQTLGPLD
jgi:hypothetical protein